MSNKKDYPIVVVSKTETTTPVAVAENATTTQSRPEPLSMAYAREALTTILRLATDAVGGNLDAWANYLRIRQIQALAEIALATPARQCDAGNAAKLREALVSLRDAVRDFRHQTVYTKYNDIMDEYTCREKGIPAVLALRDAIPKSNLALAAPPRNCDVGVPEERIQRWSKFCKARSKKLPPIHGFEWEDYPYESEAAK